MSNKIRIRKPQDTEVYIKDPDADPESEKHLMFVVKPAVRSARREVNEIAVKIVAAFEKLSDAEGAEQLALEETIVRLRCDQINALVTKPDKGQSAGDLMFQGWMDERLTEDQIEWLWDDIREGAAISADPT